MLESLFLETEARVHVDVFSSLQLVFEHINLLFEVLDMLDGLFIIDIGKRHGLVYAIFLFLDVTKSFHLILQHSFHLILQLAVFFFQLASLGLEVVDLGVLLLEGL